MGDGSAPAASALPSASQRPALIELEHVSRFFGAKTDILTRLATKARLTHPPRVLKAVNDVSLQIRAGEVVGLVGESGCGKSTLGRVAADLLPATSGRVLSHGEDLAGLEPHRRAAVKLKTQMIFQNPFASLNPRMTIAEIVGEAPRFHGLSKGDGVNHAAYVDQQLERAGLDPSLKNRYPHQFSGGQRQRVGIARALAVQPDLIICDEAVAALDVSIQAQILNLFMDLRRQLNLTYLFISHDLGVIRHISDRVAVMYLGRIVESASTTDIFNGPNHPYTQALIDEVPRIAAKKQSFSALKGELPSPLNPPPGCPFNPRCPAAFDRCKVEHPKLKEIRPDHFSACHLNE